MRRSRLVALAAVLVTVAAGCSSGPASVEGRTTVVDVEPGGRATIALAATPSLDPADAVHPSTGLLVATMCDSLLGVDPVTGELVGVLASSWTVIDGGLGVTVQLRRDATFSDGTPVTPEDVVASMTRLALPETAGSAADLLREVQGYRRIRGEIETEFDDPARSELVGVARLTDRTVSFALAAANADWAATLAHPALAILSSTALAADPDGPRRAPVCSGPYRVSEPRVDDDDVTLVRTDLPGLHPGLTNAGAGYLDEIAVTFVDDVFAAQRSGPEPVAVEPDALVTPDEPALPDDVAPEPVVAPAGPVFAPADLQRVAAGSWQAAAGEPARRLEQFEAPGLDVVGISISSADAAQNLALRGALSLALDREAIARVMDDARVPATTFVPGWLAEREGLEPCATLPRRGDVAEARRVLADSGALSGSTRLELAFNDEFLNKRLVDEVARQWQAIGITIAPDPIGWDELRSRVTRAEGVGGPFRQSLQIPLASVRAWVHPFASTSENGRTNWSRFSSPEMDETLEDASEAADDGDRALLLADAHRLACDELPVIPVGFARHGWLVADGLVSATEAFADPATGWPLVRELSR